MYHPQQNRLITEYKNKYICKLQVPVFWKIIQHIKILEDSNNPWLLNKYTNLEIIFQKSSAIQLPLFNIVYKYNDHYLNSCVPASA